MDFHPFTLLHFNPSHSLRIHSSSVRRNAISLQVGSVRRRALPVTTVDGPGSDFAFGKGKLDTRGVGPCEISPLPSEKFLKKSLKVRIWDLASICNFSELIGTNFFLGRPGLACRAAYNCLVGTKKLLPAMYVTGYNFRCQLLTTVTKGRS